MEYISVILAAGEGTRMKSKTPKVLHEAAGLPLLEWVLRAVAETKASKNIIVCGRGIEKISERFPDARCVEQKERSGSGHAVLCAKSELAGFDGYTVIVAGDMPLLRGKTISALTEAAAAGGFDCLLLSAVLDRPFGYGRIVRKDGHGLVGAIVEEKDATEEQRAIREVNASCYCVKNSVLLSCLEKIEPKNAQGEYYLTDIVELINRAGGKVGAYVAEDACECMGVNDRAQLAEAARLLNARTVHEHMQNGVTFVDPAAAYVDPDTVIGQDTVVYPNVTLEKGCEIGGDVILYPGSRLSNARIGEGTVVQNSVILDAEVGKNCTVGPYAYLRPASRVGDGCRIGDFVELKNSNIGDGTKVSHLTYIGDADFGRNINVGCGVVVVNYDGKKKYRTTVGDDVFIGCNTNLVSPVTVEDGAYIAAGSTITDPVPKDALAIARARQVVKTDWTDRRKK